MPPLSRSASAMRTGARRAVDRGVVSPSRAGPRRRSGVQTPARHHRSLRARRRLSPAAEAPSAELAGPPAGALRRSGGVSHLRRYRPALERAIGEGAGLGFIGKNTPAHHPGAGQLHPAVRALGRTSDVAPRSTVRDGSSENAGPAASASMFCPTGAFVAPYQLDASRCISYLTIENSGPIPRALRPAIGTWIFGCDLCQEVCPWNASPTLASARRS